MARVKRAVNAKKKRRRILKLAKGYYGQRSRCYRKAKEQVRHSLMYQYRDRRTKKREIRKLWITRINGMSYSQFMHGLKLANIMLDRKVLSQMAIEDAPSFADLCTISKDAIAKAATVNA